MRDVGGYGEDEVEAMRGTDFWTLRVEAAPTVTRELRAERALATERLGLDRLRVPTLLLVGTESPAWARRSTEAFAQAIPNVRVHELAGQGHGASMSAPELLASEIERFVGASD
jgi:pimeloyl-ACP methyl ester carboxylesterase